MKTFRFAMIAVLFLPCLGWAATADDFQTAVFQHDLQKIQRELESAQREHRTISEKEVEQFRHEIELIRKEIEVSLREELIVIRAENQRMTQYVEKYRGEVQELKKAIAEIVRIEREDIIRDKPVMESIVAESRMAETAFRSGSREVEKAVAQAGVAAPALRALAAPKAGEVPIRLVAKAPPPTLAPAVARTQALLTTLEKTEEQLRPYLPAQGSGKLSGAGEEKLSLYRAVLDNSKTLLKENTAASGKPLKDMATAYLAAERYVDSLPPREILALLRTEKNPALFGGYEAALLSLKLLLNKNPDDAETTFMIGKIYGEINDGVDAANYLRQALRLYEKNGDGEKSAEVADALQTVERKFGIVGSVAYAAPANP